MGFSLRKRSRVGLADNGEEIAQSAELIGRSEFDLFRLAYINWFGNLPADNTVEHEFSRYIQNDQIPYWVRQFCRHIDQSKHSGKIDAMLGRIDAMVDTEHTETRALEMPRATDPPSRQTANPLLGLAIIAVLFSIVGAIVYLAILAQIDLNLACTLPPCF